jgi:hypothetical protein
MIREVEKSWMEKRIRENGIQRKHAKGISVPPLLKRLLKLRMRAV